MLVARKEERDGGRSGVVGRAGGARLASPGVVDISPYSKPMVQFEVLVGIHSS